MADNQVDQFLDSCTTKFPIPFRNVASIVQLRVKHNHITSLNSDQHEFKDVGCGNKYTDLKAYFLFTRLDETMLAQLRMGKCRSIRNS